jgi:hypothetical protein
MLAFARQQIGKPFSNLGMARSLIMPRKSDGTSWCARPRSPPVRCVCGPRLAPVRAAGFAPSSLRPL